MAYVLYGEGGTCGSLDIMSWGLMYTGVKGSFLYGEGGTFGSLGVMWWGFMYIGVKGSSFVRRRRDIWVTGWFFIFIGWKGSFCTEKKGLFGSLDIMSWGFMYIGLKSSSFVA